MQIQKMITKVEKMKAEIVSMQKDAKAALKRQQKAENAVHKKMSKLRDKRSALTPEERGDVPGTEMSAKAKKLNDEIDEVQEQIYAMDDGTALGCDGDTAPDEGIVGALDSISFALNELVSGKGKKRGGHLPRYEEQLAEANA